MFGIKCNGIKFHYRLILIGLGKRWETIPVLSITLTSLDLPLLLDEAHLPLQLSDGPRGHRAVSETTSPVVLHGKLEVRGQQLSTDVESGGSRQADQELFCHLFIFTDYCTSGPKQPRKLS